MFFLHSCPTWCFPCYYSSVLLWFTYLLAEHSFVPDVPSCLACHRVLFGCLEGWFLIICFDRFVFLSALFNCPLQSTNLFSSINLVIHFFFYLLIDNAFLNLSNQFIVNIFFRIWSHANEGKSCASV